MSCYLGCYAGYFDPTHKGHEQLVSNILSNNLVDYCLIYPAWGGNKYKNRTAVASAIKNVTNIGILGSDTALSIVADTEKRSVFMRGIKIPEKYHEHTVGGIIALPVKDENILA